MNACETPCEFSECQKARHVEWIKLLFIESYCAWSLLLTGGHNSSEENCKKIYDQSKNIKNTLHVNIHFHEFKKNKNSASQCQIHSCTMYII